MAEIDESMLKLEMGGRTRAETFSPIFKQDAPVMLSFENLTVTTKGSSKKTLLHDISGQITGGFWAIMGASGGGKDLPLFSIFFIWF